MSYYITINGTKMDKALVETAKKNEGMPDYEFIPIVVESIMDGGKITDTEIETVNYVFKTYYAKSKLFGTVVTLLNFKKKS